MKITGLIMIMTVLMLGCQMTKSTNLSTADLYGKYQLIRFDQQQVNDPSMTMELEPGGADILKVHGILCNTFIGQATLNNGQLRSDGLASTRMACFREKEAAMENALGNMFKEGVTAKLKGNTLTLENEHHHFVYEKH